MATIQIGTVISSNRKEKGITQEELAKHLGVSKPAVSKWESGQSYPDILLLPVLASYFNITVDQLIGYEPQLTKGDIRKLYHKLADDFVKSPFDKVYTECEEYLRKYFSCWQLQHQMSILLLNHSNLAGSVERTTEIIERCLEIFRRVEKSSEDVNLAKQAVQLQAICYISLQQPIPAIDLLEELNEPFMQTETLLVKAYQMKGDNKKAIEYLQGYTYVNLITMLGAAPDFFMMYADQPDKMDHFYQIFRKLCELFEVEELQPAVLLHIYYTAAQVYTTVGKKEEAVEVLEHLMELIHKLEQKKFYLHGNKIFDVLDNYFISVDVETASPRNAEIIWKDLKKAILHNPAFAVLETEERYLRIKKRLETGL
jgi:transcriptional regulator with XRE-family HTH domain